MPGSLAQSNFGPHFSQNQTMMDNTMLLNICLVNSRGHRTNLETRNTLIIGAEELPNPHDRAGLPRRLWPYQCQEPLTTTCHKRPSSMASSSWKSWSLDNNMWKLKDHCDKWPHNAFNNTCAPYLNLESLSKSVCKLTTSKSASKVYFQ